MEILIFLDQKGNDEFFTTVSGLNFDMGGGGITGKIVHEIFVISKSQDFLRNFFIRDF